MWLMRASHKYIDKHIAFRITIKSHIPVFYRFRYIIINSYEWIPKDYEKQKQKTSIIVIKTYYWTIKMYCLRKADLHDSRPQCEFYLNIVCHTAR